MKLSFDQQTQWKRDGYLVFPALLNSVENASFKQTLDALVQETANMTESQMSEWSTSGSGAQTSKILLPDANGKLQAGRLFKVQGICAIENRILELSKNERIISAVQQLFKLNEVSEELTEIDCFGTKFFPLLPQGGTSVHWHQDNYYFGTEGEKVISCSIYFEATDRENGCLRVLPGTHKQGIFKHIKGEGEFSFGEWAEIDPKFEEAEAVDVICPPGTVVLFSPNLLHRAYQNTSKDRTGYRVAWHYVFNDFKMEWRGTKFGRGEYADRYTLWSKPN